MPDLNRSQTGLGTGGPVLVRHVDRRDMQQGKGPAKRGERSVALRAVVEIRAQRIGCGFVERDDVVIAQRGLNKIACAALVCRPGFGVESP